MRDVLGRGLRELKIRVSLVRFRLWAPSFQIIHFSTWDTSCTLVRQSCCFAFWPPSRTARGILPLGLCQVPTPPQDRLRNDMLSLLPFPWGRQPGMGPSRRKPNTGIFFTFRLTNILCYDLPLPGGSGKEGSVSRAYRHCQNHVQRLRVMVQAAIIPGSRPSAPRILRSERGFPQFTPKMGPDATVLVRPDREMWRARKVRAKTAAFLRMASCQTIIIQPIACRHGARTGTLPPLFLQTVHPP